MSLEHPFSIKTGPRFLVPPLTELLQEFNARRSAAIAAMTVYGAPESGKSTALDMLRSARIDAKSGATFHAVLRTSHPDPTFMIRGLLASSGTRQSFYSDRPEDALFNTAKVACDALGTPWVFIFIDKAECLSKAQLDMLGSVIEELCVRKLSPFICLFGRPEVLRLAAVYKGRIGASDLATFFARPHALRGLSREEVSVALGFVDSETFPKDGPTYTEHFAPAFWRRGGRLEKLGGLFAQEFFESAQGRGYTVYEVPIGYLNSAVHAFCAGAAVGDLSSRDEEQLVRQAVELSGFADSLELFGDLEGEVIAPPETPKYRRGKRRT